MKANDDKFAIRIIEDTNKAEDEDSSDIEILEPDNLSNNKINKDILSEFRSVQNQNLNYASNNTPPPPVHKKCMYYPPKLIMIINFLLISDNKDYNFVTI